MFTLMLLGYLSNECNKVLFETFVFLLDNYVIRIMCSGNRFLEYPTVYLIGCLVIEYLNRGDDGIFINQTWPTEAEMAEADKSYKEKLKKILPPGTSEYQVYLSLPDFTLEKFPEF